MFFVALSSRLVYLGRSLDGIRFFRSFSPLSSRGQCLVCERSDLSFRSHRRLSSHAAFERADVAVVLQEVLLPLSPALNLRARCRFPRRSRAEKVSNPLRATYLTHSPSWMSTEALPHAHLLLGASPTAAFRTLLLPPSSPCPVTLPAPASPLLSIFFLPSLRSWCSLSSSKRRLEERERGREAARRS